MAQTVMGIQDAGVVACAKHYIGNEQEHFRQAVSGETKFAYSANIDDVTMHELYLWYECFPRHPSKSNRFCFRGTLQESNDTDFNPGHLQMPSRLVSELLCVLTIRSTTATDLRTLGPSITYSRMS
jgi:hypothetical protein